MRPPHATQGLRPLAGVLTVLFGASLAGCTEMGRATAYESMQGSARQACTKLPDARDQIECMREHDMTYEQYRKQRAQLGGTEAARP